jgi:hypothetical protein
MALGCRPHTQLHPSSFIRSCGAVLTKVRRGRSAGRQVQRRPPSAEPGSGRGCSGGTGPTRPTALGSEPGLRAPPATAGCTEGGSDPRWACGPRASHGSVPPNPGPLPPLPLRAPHRPPAPSAARAARPRSVSPAGADRSRRRASACSRTAPASPHPASGQEEASSPSGLLPPTPPRRGQWVPPPGSRARPLAVEDRAVAGRRGRGLGPGAGSRGRGAFGRPALRPRPRGSVCACHVGGAALAAGGTPGGGKM